MKSAEYPTLTPNRAGSPRLPPCPTLPTSGEAGGGRLGLQALEPGGLGSDLGLLPALSLHR